MLKWLKRLKHRWTGNANARPRGEDWHREAVGGKWDEIGSLQFSFTKQQGLLPEHYLLDVGCGSLRGGIHFVRYLEAGHYYGVDKESELLDAARDIEIPHNNLQKKAPNLILSDRFDLSEVPESVFFDYAIAQSVFTHMTPDIIEECIRSIMPRMKERGQFYATFFEAENVDTGKPHVWRKNERGAAKYPFETFHEIANRLGYTAEYVGDWGHPRGQRMLIFSKVSRGE